MAQVQEGRKTFLSLPQGLLSGTACG
jgi:hypothetical protein